MSRSVFVQQQAKLVFQKPDSPPPGFSPFSGLRVPIIYLVYNAATGGMYFGTPPFLPCTVDADTDQVQCPNNEPFTP